MPNLPQELINSVVGYMNSLHKNPPPPPPRDFVCVGGPCDGHFISTDSPPPMLELLASPAWDPRNPPDKLLPARRVLYRLEAVRFPNGEQLSFYIYNRLTIPEAFQELLDQHRRARCSQVHQAAAPPIPERPRHDGED